MSCAAKRREVFQFFTVNSWIWTAAIFYDKLLTFFWGKRHVAPPPSRLLGGAMAWLASPWIRQWPFLNNRTETHMAASQGPRWPHFVRRYGPVPSLVCVSGPCRLKYILAVFTMDYFARNNLNCLNCSISRFHDGLICEKKKCLNPRPTGP